MAKKILHLDARDRISLGSLARHKIYGVKVEPGGVIVLTPVVIMAMDEAKKLGWSE